MQLNLKKCKFFRFLRKNPIPAKYVFDGYELELVDFLDLAVLHDPKLNFIPHITMTVNKARRVFGIALHISILEYGSSI